MKKKILQLGSSRRTPLIFMLLSVNEQDLDGNNIFGGESTNDDRENEANLLISLLKKNLKSRPKKI